MARKLVNQEQFHDAVCRELLDNPKAPLVAELPVLFFMDAPTTKSIPEIRALGVWVPEVALTQKMPVFLFDKDDLDTVTAAYRLVSETVYADPPPALWPCPKSSN